MAQWMLTGLSVLLAIFYSLTGSPSGFEFLGDVFPFPSISELQELASVLSSSSLPLFTSSSSISTSDNVVPCSGQYSGYGYYASYYYYYLDKWQTGYCQASPPACSCSWDVGPVSVMDRLLQARKATLVALLCILLTVFFAFVMVVRAVQRRWSGAACPTCSCGIGCRRDFKEIGQAGLFACCAVLL
eukprot:3544213-Amphidinium_carterae.1